MKQGQTTNITLRLDDDLLERIDRAAMQAGMSRTAYIVSWLPVNYDSNAETAQNGDSSDAR